jgi:hypothetical protein
MSLPSLLRRAGTILRVFPWLPIRTKLKVKIYVFHQIPQLQPLLAVPAFLVVPDFRLVQTRLDSHMGQAVHSGPVVQAFQLFQGFRTGLCLRARLGM